MKRLLAGWRTRRRDRYDMAVIGCLLSGNIYVYDMWHRIGGSSGAIYIALGRLERNGTVWSAWVEQPTGMPRRRRYGLTRRAVDAIAWECR